MKKITFIAILGILIGAFQSTEIYDAAVGGIQSEEPEAKTVLHGFWLSIQHGWREGSTN